MIAWPARRPRRSPIEPTLTLFNRLPKRTERFGSDVDVEALLPTPRRGSERERVARSILGGRESRARLGTTAREDPRDRGRPQSRRLTSAARVNKRIAATATRARGGGDRRVGSTRVGRIGRWRRSQLLEVAQVGQGRDRLISARRSGSCPRRHREIAEQAGRLHHNAIAEKAVSDLEEDHGAGGVVVGSSRGRGIPVAVEARKRLGSLWAPRCPAAAIAEAA